MEESFDLEQLRKGILAGERRTLAKAITLVESHKVEHQQLAQQLIESVLPKSGNSLRVGISGPPGVGKSTFIESFGQRLIEEKGAKVAVLAVDPSSPKSGGSLLADKTRMEKLSQSDFAFIRPSPAGTTLGGVAAKTREAMLLCEAAGYNYILVETVGVGQSEYEVHSMVDFFMTLIQPGSGDELQGIKKGILEMSDLVIVNKCDGDNVSAAEVTASHYTNALSLSSSEKNWSPEVLKVSSLKGDGLDKVVETLQKFTDSCKDHISKSRIEQNQKWFEYLVRENLQAMVMEKFKPQWLKFSDDLKKGSKSPIFAANEFLAVVEKSL